MIFEQMINFFFELIFLTIKRHSLLSVETEWHETNSKQTAFPKTNIFYERNK